MRRRKSWEGEKRFAMCAKRYRSDTTEIVGQSRPPVYTFASFRPNRFRIARETRRFPRRRCGRSEPRPRRSLSLNNARRNNPAVSRSPRRKGCPVRCARSRIVRRHFRLKGPGTKKNAKHALHVYTSKTHLFQTNRVFVCKPYSSRNERSVLAGRYLKTKRCPTGNDRSSD